MKSFPYEYRDSHVQFERDGRCEWLPRRDTQRSKLYRAERLAFPMWLEPGKTAPPLEEAERRIRRITRTRFWQRLCARYGNHRRSVKVVSGRGARANSYRVTLAPRARTETIICHELAHVATSGAAHHWPFAEAYLYLVGRFIGRDAMLALRAAFRDQGVRYKAPRRLAPETRATLAARMARIRPTKPDPS